MDVPGECPTSNGVEVQWILLLAWIGFYGWAFWKMFGPQEPVEIDEQWEEFVREREILERHIKRPRIPKRRNQSPWRWW